MLETVLSQSFSNTNGIYHEKNFNSQKIFVDQINSDSEVELFIRKNFDLNNNYYLRDIIFNPMRRAGLRLLDIKSTDIP